MEKKRRTKNLILAVLLLALAAGMASLPALLRSRQQEPEDKASYLSASVERKTIRSTISGGGTLEQEEGVAVKALKGVEISEYLVSNGDLVEKGQPLAVVDPISVQKTIATLQENLDYISRQLKNNPEKTGADNITLPAPGRVKEIYAKAGDKAADVMAEHGCLAVVSLDGLMALDVESPLAVDQGRDVTVVLSDGKRFTGRVEVRQGERMTVTLTDDGPRQGDTAEVFDAQGESLGTGELYIHSAWRATAISGEITNVSAAPGKTLPINGRLFSLKDVDFSQENRRLSQQRREYEDALIELFALYENNAVTAPAAGRVSGIDTAKVGKLAARQPEYRLVLLDNDTPGAPSPAQGPSGYKNYSARVADISFSSITFLVEQEPRDVKDYTAAPKFDSSRAKYKTMSSFDNVPIYELNENKEWQEIGPEGLVFGWALYFAYNEDGTLAMIIHSKQPKQSGGGGGGYYGGGGGGTEKFEMYELTETELMRVAPQDQMTVQVSIDELDILSVSQGQTAEITVDALPGRAYYGTVSQIDPLGKNTGGHTRYTITITIDKDENMLQGMNATAILTVGMTENVLTIPAAALNQRGSRSFVYTGYDSAKRELLDPVDVELGVSDGETVEILSGLSEGDRVWYSYYETEALPILFGGQSMDIA